MNRLTRGVAVFSAGIAALAVSIGSEYIKATGQTSPEALGCKPPTLSGGDLEITCGPSPQFTYRARCIGSTLVQGVEGDVKDGKADDFTFKLLPKDVCLVDHRITKDEIPPELQPEYTIPLERVAA